MRIDTSLVLAGQRTDGAFNSVTVPIYQTASFRFEEPGRTTGYDYTRSGNPTRSALEDILTELECGAGAVAVSSGMAAISTTLSLLQAGDHVICSHDCYGGTARLLDLLTRQGKLEVSYADLTDAAALVDALRSNTRLVWVETPSNPLLRIVDIESVSRFCRSAGLLLVVDNTFLSPLFQQPISLGADIVVHSTTKYINGHSDVIGGAIISAEQTLHQRIAFTANAHGATAAPFDSWLVLRGARTLPLRVRRHAENAAVVARFLEDDPRVAQVYYPGLPSHPGHDIARLQQSGFGGMLSFRIDGGADAVDRLLRSTQVFALAESLGGVESLVEHPATMSHAAMTPEGRIAAGITDDVIRLSVGVEHIDDLIEDIDRALGIACGGVTVAAAEVSNV